MMLLIHYIEFILVDILFDADQNDHIHQLHLVLVVFQIGIHPPGKNAKTFQKKFFFIYFLYFTCFIQNVSNKADFVAFLALLTKITFQMYNLTTTGDRLIIMHHLHHKMDKYTYRTIIKYACL